MLGMTRPAFCGKLAPREASTTFAARFCQIRQRTLSFPATFAATGSQQTVATDLSTVAQADCDYESHIPVLLSEVLAAFRSVQLKVHV